LRTEKWVYNEVKAQQVSSDKSYDENKNINGDDDVKPQIMKLGYHSYP
jgi:hypothetical protein